MTFAEDHTHESFFTTLQMQDALGALNRAQFHIEARLQRVLAHGLVRAEGMPTLLASLSYEQKARLAVGLGMPARVLPPLLLLGQLRDAAATSLEAGLSDTVIEQLFGLLAKPEREAVLAWHGKHNGSDVFRQAAPLQRFNVVATVLHAFMAAEDGTQVAQPAEESNEIVTFEWSAPGRSARDFASKEALYSWLIASD